MKLSRVAALVWLAACAVLGVGCLLDDVPAGYGGTCRFTGRTTTDCGKCIAKACQSEVNGCCDAGEACAPQLERLDTCAKHPEGTNCVHLSKSNVNAPPASADLNACVEASCSDVCPVKAADACAGKPQKDCIGCCFAKFQHGHDVAFQLDTTCACPPGFCAYECRLTAYCMASGPVPNDPCLTCLTNEGVYGGRCPFAEGCSNDPDCLSFTTCFQACYAP